MLNIALSSDEYCLLMNIVLQTQLSDIWPTQQNDHLNRLCVVVNVDHPDPLVVEVLRLLGEDHVGAAVAKLLLVDVEDPSLNFVLEQKFCTFW